MAVSKPLFVPWLIEQIDSERYPGVNWTNQEHTEFCIPWKHGLRQDSSDEDVRIFRAWAEISGGTHADASVWKRNFRSALRARGCEMIADKSNDGANPHKVFRLPPGYRQPVVNASPVLPLASPVLLFDNHTEDMPNQGIAYTETEYFCSPDRQSLAVDKDVLDQGLMGLTIHETQQVPIQPTEVHHASEDAMGTDEHMQRQEDLMRTMSTTMVNHTLNTQFRVLAYYRGVKVLDQPVENNAGFKVVFRPENMESSSAFTSSDPRLTPVYLPGTDQVRIIDKTQARLTQQILDELGDGLEVGVSGSAVYGLRRGGYKIYWSLSKFQKSETSQEVRKQEPHVLYTMKDFIQGLIHFINGGCESPSVSLFFCFGEKWPDHRPWEKKLIMLEVIITSFELLKLMAEDGGASSLQSVELQISDKPSLSIKDMLEQLMDTC